VEWVVPEHNSSLLGGDVLDVIDGDKDNGAPESADLYLEHIGLFDVLLEAESRDDTNVASIGSLNQEALASREHVFLGPLRSGRPDDVLSFLASGSCRRRSSSAGSRARAASCCSTAASAAFCRRKSISN
jgi:hypothetical protein